MPYDIYLFDLDGTLTDALPGIEAAFRYALGRLGVETSGERLRKALGPPLMYSFREIYGLDEAGALRGVALYREYYSERGMFENAPYPGAAETLAALKAAGKAVVLATSKIQPYAERILGHFGLTEYFDFVAGSEDETRKTKADVIRWALDAVDPKRERRAVMIGDRSHDALGAAECGIPCIGALYGYGTREELAAAGVTVFIGGLNELTGGLA